MNTCRPFCYLILAPSDKCRSLTQDVSLVSHGDEIVRRRYELDRIVYNLTKQLKECIFLVF